MLGVLNHEQTNLSKKRKLLHIKGVTKWLEICITNRLNKERVQIQSCDTTDKPLTEVIMLLMVKNIHTIKAFVEYKLLKRLFASCLVLICSKRITCELHKNLCRHNTCVYFFVYYVIILQ